MRPIIHCAPELGYLVAARKLDVSYKMLPVLVENYSLTSLRFDLGDCRRSKSLLRVG